MKDEFYRERRKRALADRLWEANIQDGRADVDRVLKLIESGCPFFDRCPVAVEGTCDREIPPIRNLGGGHTIGCHRDLESTAR